MTTNDKLIGKEYLLQVAHPDGRFFAVEILDDKPYIVGDLSVREAANVMKGCVDVLSDDPAIKEKWDNWTKTSDDN